MKPYVLPDLAYDYGALEPHYSARVLELHHDKHHKAYVDGVNSTLDKLAAALIELDKQIPKDIAWVLRVDGHTDRQPIKGSAAFPSNWELSVARAITVVKLLIADGVPAEHLAATGFADNQPLDADDTPDAYAKNRRIELRLTDR